MTEFKIADALANNYKNNSTEQWFDWVEQLYDRDEESYVSELLNASDPQFSLIAPVQKRAQKLVEQVRAKANFAHSVDKLLQEYSLNNEEGIILMCLAEALMRIPDSHTADKLIADKISSAHWDSHLGSSDSLLVNASTWGLLLTGKVTEISASNAKASSLLERLLNSAGEPVIRAAIYQAMKIMGKQFVLGQNINEAIKNGKSYRNKGYTYSFDMLGEAALTDSDAQQHFQDYVNAIESLGSSLSQWAEPLLKPSISIKLSALHPRYESVQEQWVLSELYQRLLLLAQIGRKHGVAVTVDAEEADRLEISLKLFARVFAHASLQGWGGFGLVVQAYLKTALPTLGYICALAAQYGVVIPVRLVKGAYWDSEIKWAQIKGQATYPVFTRKENSDLSYMLCADFLLSQQKNGHVYPQFATHNAHTVAFVNEMAKRRQCSEFEFQRLHGMGDALFDLILSEDKANVRIYAPVGVHRELLPYLVRRLLENGANSSFVHRLVDVNTPINELIASPLQTVATNKVYSNEQIPLPANIFMPERRNSAGINIQIKRHLESLQTEFSTFKHKQWFAKPEVASQQVEPSICPYLKTLSVGEIHWCSPEEALTALASAQESHEHWRQVPVEVKAVALNKMADLIEQHHAEFTALCIREAGKTIQDAIDEIRESVDFLRYYALQAVQQFALPTQLNGPTGERNEHYYEGRGVFVCISPWNFPLAIFIGQISAALVAGNTVIAKPAESTSLIAARAIELFHQAGIPTTVLHFVAGSGVQLGQALLSDNRVAGVAFTGSTMTAKMINRQLAARDGAIATFIAETGGNNAMIVDSTALPEQVVNDAFHSAFASAGQRCSALRILCVQDEIADHIIALIEGALARWRVGNPENVSTDAGPVIDEKAYRSLSAYIEQWREKGAVLAQGTLSKHCEFGWFIAPTLIEINSLTELGGEQFGPVLHVLRYKSKQLDRLIDDINAMGYGLTLGIHSRNQATAAHIERRARVGNCYINRNQIGAVVGVQPFGGCGLSGTGPKAGGANYLQRFAIERTRTINTTAIGGNASLLATLDPPTGK